MSAAAVSASVALVLGWSPDAIRSGRPDEPAGGWNHPVGGDRGVKRPRGGAASPGAWIRNQRRTSSEDRCFSRPWGRKPDPKGGWTSQPGLGNGGGIRRDERSETSTTQSSATHPANFGPAACSAAKSGRNGSSRDRRSTFSGGGSGGRQPQNDKCRPAGVRGGMRRLIGQRNRCAVGIGRPLGGVDADHSPRRSAGRPFGHRGSGGGSEPVGPGTRRANSAGAEPGARWGRTWRTRTGAGHDPGGYRRASRLGGEGHVSGGCGRCGSSRRRDPS